MSRPDTALAVAEAQVAAVRDDPAARLALMAQVFHGPTGQAPRHLPFRRAALSFMRWQARRGVLDPLDASPPGSVWWRAVNARLLRDGCETIALLGGAAGEPSSQAVRPFRGTYVPLRHYGGARCGPRPARAWAGNASRKRTARRGGGGRTRVAPIAELLGGRPGGALRDADLLPLWE
jgi:hypothetical protein